MAAQIDDANGDLSSTYTKGASVSATLTKVDSAAIPAGPYYDDYSSESYIMKGYTSDYTENTVLAVAFKYDGSNWVNQVLNSYVAEKVTSGVSAYTKDYIKADGTKYTYAAEVDSADADSTYSSDDEYDIYVSKDGYAIAVTGAGLANLNDVYYTAAVDDDTDGVASITVYSDEYNGDSHLLSDGDNFDDVSYADAKIVGARMDDAKDASAYSGTISSVGALESALDKVDASTASSAKGIKLDVYVKDGAILFIAITEVEKAANQAPDGGDETNAQFDGLSVATVGTTTTITATMTENVDKDVTLSVKVQKESTSGWLDCGTCKVTINKGSKIGTGTVENLTAGNY